VAGADGLVAFWDMEVWPIGEPSRKIVTKGMDLLMVRGDQVCMVEVYFDRNQLKPLLRG